MKPQFPHLGSWFFLLLFCFILVCFVLVGGFVVVVFSKSILLFSFILSPGVCFASSSLPTAVVFHSNTVIRQQIAAVL